jgi:hypothetical protein
MDSGLWAEGNGWGFRGAQSPFGGRASEPHADQEIALRGMVENLQLRSAHRCHILKANGESYRLRQARKRSNWKPPSRQDPTPKEKDINSLTCRPLFDSFNPSQSKLLSDFLKNSFR